MTVSILEAKHLSKSYKKRQVVKDVSLHVKSGEIVGLLGPNGAGKTTSFYMIVGLVNSQGGEILLDGVDISRKPIHTRAKLGIGYLPQEASVFRKLSVADNVMAILELRQDLNKTERIAELKTLLEEFGLTHLAETKGMSLSGGERRRLEIARAVAIDPKFILLDEPFAGVDPISIIDLKRFIRHLQQREIGILITDHNVRETLDICERAYIVNSGSILCEGTPNEILENQQVRKVYLGESFSL
jgi:lipopolysaccharide export system ATP-binding protein